MAQDGPRRLNTVGISQSKLMISTRLREARHLPTSSVASSVMLLKWRKRWPVESTRVWRREVAE
jgi:hypothetical protein